MVAVYAAVCLVAGHGGHHLLQLVLVVFYLGALAHLLMYAQTNRDTLYVVVVEVVFLCGGIYSLTKWLRQDIMYQLKYYSFSYSQPKKQ